MYFYMPESNVYLIDHMSCLIWSVIIEILGLILYFP